MGKSRKLKTKRMGDTLLDLYPDKFTTNFDENKQHLTDVLTITSTTIRNQIAGYITSVMNKESRFS
jgi:small subunit ribosomal protein S17e